MLTKVMTKASRQFLFIAVALALGLMVLGGLAFRNLADNGAQGVAAIGGPFAMTAQDGRALTDADLKGHPTLIFFGYTHCPDFCPTTLTQISSVFKEMGPDKKIEALFVTIDPQRDTPDTMKTYLESFDPRIIGLSGNEAQTRAIAKAYKVYFKKEGADNGDYTMDHTGVVYLMDKNGRFVSAFNLDRPAKQAADELTRYL
ncbi:SCO family protein [Methylocella tundrae]|uniref:SCO family protein n=2 Tax=Methylocella tundrae TaxID=227605 RepID=A0A4U8Z4P0_METTU|nr:SCO family protein [Methylocella tundrae]